MAEKFLLNGQIPVLRLFKDFSVKRQDFQQRLILHQGITNTVGQLRHSQLEPMQKLEIGNQQIMDHCHPDLRHHCVFACAEKAFYLHILFDPFEKEFDLPSLFVNFCDASESVDFATASVPR